MPEQDSTAPWNQIPPLDLEMRVRVTIEKGGQMQLVYTLASPSGAVRLYHRSISGDILQRSPDEYHAYLRQKMEKLSERLDVDGKPLLQAEIEHKLTSLGHDLWDELFPAALKDLYRAIRRTVKTWMIVSDEPWIPWELVKPYDDSQPDDIIDDDFLSLKFQLTRWLPKGRNPSPEIQVRQFAVIRPAKPEERPETSEIERSFVSSVIPGLQRALIENGGVLPPAQDERFLLIRLNNHPLVRSVTPFLASASDLLTFLETGEAGLLHFIGHGTVSAAQADDSALSFEDGSAFRPGDLTGRLKTRIRGNSPLVFMNICWGGQQGWSLTRLGGWASRWVEICGCAAFIAPLWPVRNQAATLFATAFYEAAIQHGASLGEAALVARRRLRQERPGDPSSLAYVMYAHPNTRLRFGFSYESSQLNDWLRNMNDHPVKSMLDLIRSGLKR
jgi:hypothetical protein